MPVLSIGLGYKVQKCRLQRENERSSEKIGVNFEFLANISPYWSRNLPFSLCFLAQITSTQHVLKVNGPISMPRGELMKILMIICRFFGHFMLILSKLAPFARATPILPRQNDNFPIALFFFFPKRYNMYSKSEKGKCHAHCKSPQCHARTFLIIP